MRRFWMGVSAGIALLCLLGATNPTTITQFFGAGFRVGLPPVQTIAAGGTIEADVCGGVKWVTAAGAVTTSTVNTFSNPVDVPGCVLMVCNIGANAITLDRNANMLHVGGADVVLAASSCVSVYSSGNAWRQTTAQLTAS